MSKLKMTGFGKFFIFILILAPIVYFGVNYLNDSGALDEIKEKVERRQELPAETTQSETGSDILNEINNKDENRRAQKQQEELIAEQQRKIKELERQNQDLRGADDSKSSTSTLPPLKKQEVPRTNPTTNNQNGAPSLNDLVREAEKNMREKGNDPNLGGSEANSPNLGNSRKSLATWTFSFSNVNGTIELYQESNRLMSRTAYQGTDRIDIQELVEQDEKLYVRNSPTREYYVLRSNGDLDAYDNSGFLTTCTRR